MSAVYNLEPPTTGKVVLKTTAGDIDIELWPKEAPKAVRNFVQLCLEGYYDGCVFHRVLKDFLAQTGDPKGTGTSSETIYGSPFKDEFHSRLRFSHRGIVACANANEEHSNGSQFFITLGPTESLQKKNTIFGRIGGETIYNVMEFNNLEVDSQDRPEHPPIIQEVEVLWNPFEDIIPRSTRAERESASKRAAEAEAAAAKPSKRRKKNVDLLSFGDDGDGEESEANGAMRLKSAHEAIDDARLVKVDTEEERHLAAQEEADADIRRAAVAARFAKAAMAAKLRGTAAAPAAAADLDGNDDDEQDNAEAGFDAKMRNKVMRDRQIGPPEQQTASPANDSSSSDEGGKPSRTDARRDAALTAGSKAAAVKPSRQSRVEDAELLKPWELKRREFKQKKRLTGNRDKDTLAAMRDFSKQLATLPSDAVPSAAARDGTAAPPAQTNVSKGQGYAGKVRQDIDHAAHMPAAWRIDALQDESSDEEEGGLLASLRRSKLAFPKDAKAGNMDRNMDDDSLMVVDPLLEAGKAEWNKQQAKLEKRQKRQEWEAGAAGGGRGTTQARR